MIDVLEIRGKGNFDGVRYVPVKSVDVSEQTPLKVKINIESADLIYDGTEKKPDKIKVINSRTSFPLLEGRDYQIRYPKNITDVGTVKISVVGIGKYRGSATASYKIKPVVEKDTTKFSVQILSDTTYTAGGVKPDLSVTYGDLVLTAGKDYKVSYSGNKKAGSNAKYNISFIGNFKGSKKLSGSFTIGKASLAGARVAAADKIYKKAGTYASAPVVYLDGTQVAKSEYSVKYYDSTGEEINNKHKLDLGTVDSAIVTVKVEAKEGGSYSGSASGTYKVIKLSSSSASYTDISKASVTIMPKGQTTGKRLSKLSYTGSAITFAPTNTAREGDMVVTIGKGAQAKALTYGVDYTVTYVNNMKKGKATMLITGVPDRGYVGSKSVNFTIGTKDVGLLGGVLKKLFG